MFKHNRAKELKAQKKKSAAASSSQIKSSRHKEKYVCLSFDAVLARANLNCTIKLASACHTIHQHTQRYATTSRT